MKLSVDFTDLHKAASKMIDIPRPTLDSALQAGNECRLHGPSPTNCHWLYFETPELTQSWERGNTSKDKQ